MKVKSIGVLRGYAMGKTQLSRIADNIEREVEEALEFERAENAKLQELVKRYHQLVTGTDKLWSWQSVYEQLRELGIEVDE